MAATFLDTSAIVKLVLHEPESLALIEFLDGRTDVEASELAVAEGGRAVRRAHADADAAGVLEALSLHRVSSDVLRRAALLEPLHLRTLDAIHLATALLHGDGDGCLVTYDTRMATAARAHGLRVVQPGR